jgi:PAS domain S-box-containing protein
MGIARDITERRRAQDALRGSEERYRAVVENAHMAIVIIQHGEFVFANPMMAGILGCSLENLIGRPFLDVVHPDDRSEVIDMHQKRLRGEPMPASYEGRVVRKDGSVRWLEVSGVPIEWEGRPAALDFALDITERKRTHEKIIRQAGLLQTVSDAIIATDKDFNITSWNKAAERTYGFTEAEVLGRMVDEVTQLEYPNQRREDVVEEFFREGHWQGEVIQKHKNGDRVDIYASVTALRDD